MKLIKARGFPATWLLQADALKLGPYVEFLKLEMPSSHETGLWFEMSRTLCEDAGIPWRGKPKWEWDYHVPVDYGIGYTPDDRRRLVDTAMATYQRTFGHGAKVVASWMIDAVTAAHFSDNYGIDALAISRDQLATDGFTIWGAPIAAYYPSRNNAYSPALSGDNQIGSPIFRLLGQDPVYYYENQLPYPDTMEPVWPSGQAPVFVHRFLDMIATSPTQSVAYAQLGQENSFGWPQMRKAYPMQMSILTQQQREGLIVETMGETGRRLKRRFSTTPTQAQVMLQDPFGHKHRPERTVWYQSKYYRGNLHFRDSSFYLRDLHVYSDQFPQLYLESPIRHDYVGHRMLAVLDGYHWSDSSALAGGPGIRAMGRFVAVVPDGRAKTLVMDGAPTVTQSGTTLRTIVPLCGGGEFFAEFHEADIAFRLRNAPLRPKLGIAFEWVADQTAFQGLSADRLNYRFRDFDYSVRIANGSPAKTSHGVTVMANGRASLSLQMAQQRVP